MQEVPINWEPILWIATGVGSLIIALLSIIAVLLKEDRAENKEYRIMFSSQLKEQQKEITQVSINTQLAVELIKHEQEFGKQRLESFISFVEQGKYYVKPKRK